MWFVWHFIIEDRVLRIAAKKHNLLLHAIQDQLQQSKAGTFEAIESAGSILVVQILGVSRQEVNNIIKLVHKLYNIHTVDQSQLPHEFFLSSSSLFLQLYSAK